MKIALLGCGQIAHIHLRFIRKLGYNVDSVCDSSAIRAEQFARQYAIPHCATTIEELFSQSAPDIVHILVPPHLHKELAIACLQRGAHVVIEKPVCETVADLGEIEAAAKACGKQFVVDHTRVYNPMLIKIRDCLDSGAYGKIVRLEYDYDDPSIIQTSDPQHPLAYAKGTPPWLMRLKGGVLTDLLPHPVSVLLSLCPDLEIADVNGRVSNGIVSDALIRLENATATALIKLSVNIRPLHNQLKIFCERGTITLDLRNLYCIYSPQRELPNIIARTLDSLSNGSQLLGRFMLNTLRILSGKLHTYSGLDEILRQFYLAIEKQQPADINYLNTRRVVELSEIILDRLMAGQPDFNQRQQLLQTQLSDRLQQPADILVTGASGFIGRTLVNELLDKKQRVRGLCRSFDSANSLPANAAVAIGNMSNLSSLQQAMRDTAIVYHCAAAMQGDWAEYYDSTVNGTKNLLQAFAESNARQLVYVSSLGILDYERMQDGDIVDERSPVEKNPSWRGFYTQAKKEAEDLVQQFIADHPEKNVWIIRPGLVYGAHSNKNLNNAGVLLGRWLLVFGMGSRQLGLCHVDYLTSLLAALHDKYAETDQHLLHITDSEQPTVKDYIRAHNARCAALNLSQQQVRAIYIPVWLWRSAFAIVDRLLQWKSGRNPRFSYRFNSNAKTLKYVNNRCRATVRVEELSFNENLAKTVER